MNFKVGEILAEHDGPKYNQQLITNSIFRCHHQGQSHSSSYYQCRKETACILNKLVGLTKLWGAVGTLGFMATIQSAPKKSERWASHEAQQRQM